MAERIDAGFLWDFFLSRVYHRAQWLLALYSCVYSFYLFSRVGETEMCPPLQIAVWPLVTSTTFLLFVTTMLHTE